jgi:putative spermidine/putrescine transport system permease protein
MIFLVLSCFILLRYSFNGWDPVRTMYDAWIPDNYIRFFTDEFYRQVFLDTVQISLIVTVASLLLGYPLAYLVSISRHRSLLMFLIIMPLVMDVLVRAYGWIILLSDHGLVNVLLVSLGLLDSPTRLIYTRLSVVLELLHEVLPFTILPIASVVQKIDPSLKEASIGLGASKLRTFIQVTLPLSMPGILAGTILTFALGMSAFVAPLVLGGGRVNMMSTLIRQQMTVLLNWPLGSAEAIILVFMVMILMYFYTRALRRAS